MSCYVLVNLVELNTSRQIYTQLKHDFRKQNKHWNHNNISSLTSRESYGQPNPSIDYRFDIINTGPMVHNNTRM